MLGTRERWRDRAQFLRKQRAWRGARCASGLALAPGCWASLSQDRRGARRHLSSGGVPRDALQL